MGASRTDFVVTYVIDGGKQRKRSFWREGDARAFARSSNASRIEKQSIEVIWELEESATPNQDTGFLA
jgi:hypothetical protein